VKVQPNLEIAGSSRNLFK